MKYIRTFDNINESKKDDEQIDNIDIINFAKIYNKEKGYSNKCESDGYGHYTFIIDNPFDVHKSLIVGDLALNKFIRNAKDDGMSDTLYMRALTNKVNKKYGGDNVINVSNDINHKIDMSKKKSGSYDITFRPIDDKQIVNLMNKLTIIDEGTLIVNKKGEIKKDSTGNSWLIQYKESDDYIFTNFHSGWNVLMKESDFISNFMKDSEFLINVNKYNL